MLTAVVMMRGSMQLVNATVCPSQEGCQNGVEKQPWLGWLKKAIAALAFVLLSLAKGKVVMFNVGKTNAAMACPARPQANKADECRTLKNNTDSPNHQVFKMLST